MQEYSGLALNNNNNNNNNKAVVVVDCSETRPRHPLVVVVDCLVRRRRTGTRRNKAGFSAMRMRILRARKEEGCFRNLQRVEGEGCLEEEQVVVVDCLETVPNKIKRTLLPRAEAEASSVEEEEEEEDLVCSEIQLERRRRQEEDSLAEEEEALVVDYLAPPLMPVEINNNNNNKIKVAASLEEDNNNKRHPRCLAIDLCLSAARNHRINKDSHRFSNNTTLSITFRNRSRRKRKVDRLYLAATWRRRRRCSERDNKDT